MCTHTTHTETDQYFKNKTNVCFPYFLQASVCVVYTSTWRGGWLPGSSSITLHLNYWGKFSVTLEFPDSASLAGQLALGSPCLCLQSVGIKG